MLLIAQPRSASTSLMDTLGKVTGLDAVQLFSVGGVSYKKKYPTPTGYIFLHHRHTDFREVPVDHVVGKMADRSTFHKNHFPPTPEMLKLIRGTAKRVVILLRDPEAGMNSYKKLNVVNYKKSLGDLKKFNAEYRKLEGLENVCIVTYEDLIENTQSVLSRILTHYRLPLPSTLHTIELSKKRVAGKYRSFLSDKTVAFVGPAPSIVGKGLSDRS